MSNCNTRIKLILLISMLFSLTIGQMWADDYLKGSWDGWSGGPTFEDGVATLEITKVDSYQFKILLGGSSWTGAGSKDGDKTISSASTSVELSSSGSGGNINFTADRAGLYTFTLSGSTVTVTYPTTRTYNSGQKIYLKDVASAVNWNGDGAAYWGQYGNVYAYFSGDGTSWSSEATVASGSKGTANAIYEITVPGSGKKFTSVYFARGSSTSAIWNRTPDQSSAVGYNCFYISGTSAGGKVYKGSWGKYAKNPALIGSFNDWDPDQGTFTDGRVILELSAETDYEFKVLVGDGSDGNNYWSCTACGKATNTVDPWQQLYSNQNNWSMTTGEAGEYMFHWNNDTHYLGIYYPQTRLTKNTVLYLNVSNETYWNKNTFDAKFWFKYYDSGSDYSNTPLVCSTPVETNVYYVTIPNNDWLGRVQVERWKNGSQDGHAEVSYAFNRSSSAQNCLKEETGKTNYKDYWTPQWDTYCPPMSKPTLSDNSPTTYGGNGTSGSPYLVAAGSTITFTASGSTSSVNDANMTAKYQFKDGATSKQDGTGTSYTHTVSSTNNANHTITVEAYNYYNSVSSNHTASDAIYYQARTIYDITYNKGTYGEGDQIVEKKAYGVAKALRGSGSFTRTGYNQTAWNTNPAGTGGTNYALSASYTGNAALTVYPTWTAKTYTINLANMEATTAGTTSVTVTYDASTNMTASDPITKPTKTHYDFAGYWTSENTGATLDHQLIGADGKWIKDVEGYTSHDGAGNPTWVHDYPISLYAKWTEHEYAITMEVSPAGTGTTSPASTAIGKLVTESGNITATPAAGYKFKEWQFSKTDENYDAWCADGYSSTDATIHIKAQHNGTLTAVFEERYSLVGSLQDNSGNGGMPGWVDYTKTFTVNSSSPVDLTRTCTLQANKTYKLQVHDLATSTNLGRSGCDPVCVLEENASLVMENSNNDVFLYTSGAGEYIFKITAVDGSGHPTLTVLRPYPVNFGQKYLDIDGTLHAGTTGGTASASASGALSSGDYVTYNTSVTHTATPASGYTFAGWWSSDAFEGNRFSNTNPMTYAVTYGDNAYAKFVETSTSVTLANDGNGKVQIGGADATSTTCGVTTTRSLTAVPNEGYKFSSWTKVSGDDITIGETSDNPLTLTGRGSGLTSGQEVRANFVERYSIKGTMNGENWGTTHTLSNIGTNASSKDTGYVEMTLPANTSYQFAIYDEQTGNWLKNRDDGEQVYYMTYGNSKAWGFGTDKEVNCGITTAGAGTYKFIFNITDKTVTVVYPTSYLVNLGVKAYTIHGNAEGDFGGTVSATASAVSYDNGSYIANGASITISATPSDGYDFEGWYTSSTYEVRYETNTSKTWTVSEAVNAYAKFIEKTNTFSTTSGNNWSTTANWSAGHVPTLDEVAIINAPVTVDITNAKAKRVLLMQNSSNTGRIEIPAGKELIVKETVRKTTDGSSYGATAANDIYIGSNASNGLGALVMGSHDGTNKATVDFYTTSYGDKNNNTSVAQYVGTPFNDETNILYNWHNSWIYGIKYTNNTIGWDRVNEGQGMDPFRGYCVFSADAWNNAEGHSYWQQGTLVASENHTCSSLNYQSGTYTNPNNENLLANSWMAPIYIKAMETGDFVKTEATIYIFNSTSAKGFVSLANNYTAYTVNTADEVIPAMQSFSVFTNASGGSSVTLDYNKIVYTPAVNGTATPTANKAPRRAGYTEDEADKMKLFVSTKSGYGDMLYMWERADFVDGFENGWDGHKLFGESVAPQLYAITPDGYMAVNCVPDWEGAVVGFRKGTEDNVYTFSFEYEGDGTWYLNDLKEQYSAPISPDNTYMFTATDNDEARFIISRTPIQYVPTGTERSDISNQTSAVRKLIIDEHVYIIRGGRMYDATGVPVK